jgi:hypothetical protein
MTTRMKLPDGACNFSVDGQNLEVVDGHVIVPKHFIDHACANGLTVASAEAMPETVFSRGLRVSFECEGEQVVGNIKGINKQTSEAIILDDNADKYTVHTSHLTLVE